MLANEEEARTKTCPIMTHDHKRSCVASGCMFWTWAERQWQFYEIEVGTRWPEHLGDMRDWELEKEFDRDRRRYEGSKYVTHIERWQRWRKGNSPNRKGYCGAAARPVISRLNTRYGMSGGITDGL